MCALLFAYMLHGKNKKKVNHKKKRNCAFCRTISVNCVRLCCYTTTLGVRDFPPPPEKGAAVCAQWIDDSA